MCDASLIKEKEKWRVLFSLFRFQVKHDFSFSGNMFCSVWTRISIFRGIIPGLFIETNLYSQFHGAKSS